MKAFLVLACVAVAAARPEAPGGYNYPSSSGSSGILGVGGLGIGSLGVGSLGSGSFGSSGGFGSGISGGSTIGNLQSSGGQVHRHVYVHVAPDDPEDQQARVIRIPSKNDKHVNIIFVKTPSQSSAAQTEVILPEQDQQKNIVYVLVKKFDPTTDLKIRGPRPTAPAKPEVYFIRYKNQQGQQSGSQGQGPSDSYGPPSPPQSNPRPEYGLPAF